MLKTIGTDVTNLPDMYKTEKQWSPPPEIVIKLLHEYKLKYGENPHQGAAKYKEVVDLLDHLEIKEAKTGKGGFSKSNLLDGVCGLQLLKYFDELTLTIIKHRIPCAFATHIGTEPPNFKNIYNTTLWCDYRSAFGGILIGNKELEEEDAQIVSKNFLDVLFFPSYSEKALTVLRKKKNLRMYTFSNLDKLPRFVGDPFYDFYDITLLPTGEAIVEEPYLSKIRNIGDFIIDPMVVEDGNRYIVQREPTAKESLDLLIAWRIAKSLKINGVAIIKDGVLKAIGLDLERVGGLEKAITKALQKEVDRKRMMGKPESLKKPNYCTGGKMSWQEMIDELGYNPIIGSVVSSNGFYPFRDSIDLMAEMGISATIEPGGSIRDREVIEAANEYDISLVFAGERCFSH